MAKAQTKKKHFTKQWFEKTFFLTCILIMPLIQFLVFYVYMNFENIMIAFKAMSKDGSTRWVGLTNFKNVIKGTDTGLILISAWNNIKLCFLSTAIGMPMNILYGYYIHKKKFGSTAVRIVYMLPNMVSGLVMTMLFLKFMEVGIPQVYQQATGKVLPNLLRSEDTAFGIQVFYTLWLGFSSSLIIYSNAMNAVDPGIFEAGKIDGCTTFDELTRLVVPLIFPTLSTYIITGVAGLFTASGSLFLFYGLNNVPEKTYFLGFYLFKIALTGDLTAYPQAAAVSVMITMVSVPLTLFVRWLMNRIDPMRDNYADL